MILVLKDHGIVRDEEVLYDCLFLVLGGFMTVSTPCCYRWQCRKQGG